GFSVTQQKSKRSGRLQLLLETPSDNDVNLRFQCHTLPQKHWTFLENVQHVLDFSGITGAVYGESFQFEPMGTGEPAMSRKGLRQVGRHFRFRRTRYLFHSGKHLVISPVPPSAYRSCHSSGSPPNHPLRVTAETCHSPLPSSWRAARLATRPHARFPRFRHAL
ncbi:hypothetical protein EVAR_59912_1, partial [Eumeta japonica]